MLPFLCFSNIWILLPFQHIPQVFEIWNKWVLLSNPCCCDSFVSWFKKIKLFLICDETMLLTIACQTKVKKRQTLKVLCVQTKRNSFVVHFCECRFTADELYRSNLSMFTTIAPAFISVLADIENEKRVHWFLTNFISFFKQSHFFRNNSLLGLILLIYIGGIYRISWSKVALRIFFCIEYQFDGAWTITSSLGNSIFLEYWLSSTSEPSGSSGASTWNHLVEVILFSFTSLSRRLSTSISKSPADERFELDIVFFLIGIA